MHGNWRETVKRGKDAGDEDVTSTRSKDRVCSHLTLRPNWRPLGWIAAHTGCATNLGLTHGVWYLTQCPGKTLGADRALPRAIHLPCSHLGRPVGSDSSLPPVRCV